MAELLSHNVNWAKAVLNSSLSPLPLSFSFLLYCSGKEADLFGGYRAWQHLSNVSEVVIGDALIINSICVLVHSLGSSPGGGVEACMS